MRRLVELHGGIVTGESEGPGKGSTFRVHLPIQAHASPPKLCQGAAAANSKSHSLRILVVDDNADAALSLSLLLQLRGHRTEIAYDGQDALNAAASFRPELVFLDLGMPVMSGYEVARRLRTIAGLEHVLCVALTGWGSENDRLRSKDAGFDKHLTKPVELEDLERVISEFSPVH